MEGEDYVSFEVAKLLKEKGFNCPCKVVYSPKGIIKHYLKEEVYAHNLKGHKKLCPTHQMAMKWLRENHNVFIEMKRDNQYYLGMPVTPVTKEDKERGHKPLYYANVLDEKADSMTTEKKESYEEAVEEALKIALKNEMYL